MPTLPRTTTRPPWMPERKAHERRNAPNRAFYNSTAARKLAKFHRSANPFCCDPFNRQCNGLTEVSDHIIPINQGGKEMDLENRQPLCNGCHNLKSAFDGVLAKKGQHWFTTEQYMNEQRRLYAKKSGKEAHSQKHV